MMSKRGKGTGPAAGVTGEKIFRAVARTGKVWGSGISENVV